MAVTTFNREAAARRHARLLLKYDPGVSEVYYLPTNAPDREVRLLEVNRLMAERPTDVMVAVGYGQFADGEKQHRLSIIDATPHQWTLIRDRVLPLPDDWSLDGLVFLGSKTA